MSSNKKEKKKHVFTWKIENVSMCPSKKGGQLLSPAFKAKSFDESTWYLVLFLRGHKSADDGFTSLFLKREEDDAVHVAIECDFMLEVVNEKGHAIKFVKCSQKFEKGSGFGVSNYMKTDEFLKTALSDDSLTIRCTLSGNIPENNFYSQNTSTTKLKISNHSFQLMIKALNSLTEHEVIKLPCLGSSQLEITVHIAKDDVKICIIMIESSSNSKFILCNFKLLDVAGKEREARRETHLFENAEPWEFPTFIKMSKINAEKDLYINDGCFTLQCDITVSDGSTVEDIENNAEIPFTNEFTASDVDTIAVLNEDLKRMYADKIHTDIKLKAGEKAFSAHKNILCARSPVFLAMFDNDMTESQKGEVDIPDLDEKTVDLLLEYMYTGTVNDLDYENTLKLIVAADKYQIMSLKNKCAAVLTSMLSDTNVCEILVTADLVQHDALKTSVLKFIKLQPKKIFRSEEWKHFARNNLLLATETASEVAIMLEELAKQPSW